MNEHSERPWGTYDVLADAADFKVKTIEVHPGQRLSYQTHSRRSEHWFVVRGKGFVTLEGKRIDVQRGDAVDIPVGAAHRIQNTGDGPLLFVEVQHGDYFGEDDIVRLEDDYGRLSDPRPSGQSAPGRISILPDPSLLHLRSGQARLVSGGRLQRRARRQGAPWRRVNGGRMWTRLRWVKMDPPALSLFPARPAEVPA